MYSKIKKKTIDLLLLMMIILLTGCGSVRSGIKMPSGAKDYVGRNYDEVVCELQGLGFSVFEDTVVDDLNSASSVRDGSIELITINGLADFKVDDVFDPKDCVAIKYHIIKKISSPLSAQEIEKSDVESIIGDYKSAGFTNIRADEVYDLDPDTLQTDHISEVKISGEKVENTTDQYPFDADVLVVGHYPYQKYDLNIALDFDKNILFSKYDVSVIFNGENVASLKHGEDWNTQLRLKRGTYELRFCKSGDDTVNGATSIELLGNTQATYRIHCNSNKIDVKTQNFDQDKMPDIDEVKLLCNSDAYRNRNYAEVENELRRIGFENVKDQEVTNYYDNGIAEGTTLAVTINGNEYFNEGEIYKKDANVVVSYNKPEEKPIDNTQVAVVPTPDIVLEDIGKANTKEGSVERSVVAVPETKSSTENGESTEKAVDNKEPINRNQASENDEAVIPKSTDNDSSAEKRVKVAKTTKESTEATNKVNEPVKQVTGEIVYITKTGEKYHRAGCKYLKKSQIEITKQDAIKRGKEPCSVCKP